MAEALEDRIGEILRARGLRLATAESCTGGLVGHRLTNVPGSSTYFMGGVVAYAYEAKVRLLDVKWETLETYGAVSAETVTEMALGARWALAADLGVAVSGIAGPTGGTPEKPVGLVWLALSSPYGHWTRRNQFEGNRQAVKEQAAEAALALLLEYLEGKLDAGD